MYSFINFLLYLDYFYSDEVSSFSYFDFSEVRLFLLSCFFLISSRRKFAGFSFVSVTFFQDVLLFRALTGGLVKATLADGGGGGGGGRGG